MSGGQLFFGRWRAIFQRLIRQGGMHAPTSPQHPDTPCQSGSRVRLLAALRSDNGRGKVRVVSSRTSGWGQPAS
nr:hypothetical protein BgiMline_032138 [Biomphalaria glabrata]